MPDGYIRTKRQAEEAVLALCADSALRATDTDGKGAVDGVDGGVVRPVLVRPGTFSSSAFTRFLAVIDPSLLYPSM